MKFSKNRTVSDIKRGVPVPLLLPTTSLTTMIARRYLLTSRSSRSSHRSTLLSRITMSPLSHVCLRRTVPISISLNLETPKDSLLSQWPALRMQKGASLPFLNTPNAEQLKPMTSRKIDWSFGQMFRTVKVSQPCTSLHSMVITKCYTPWLRQQAPTWTY